jgi:RNA polymerase sigma-70 factor (ECF subfamily)
MAELVIGNQAMAAAQMAEDAVEEAVRDYARLVFRIAYSVLRHHHEAEDATQETFLRVLRYRKRLETAGDRRAWVARIAWRVAVERSKNRRHAGLDEAGERAGQVSPSVSAEQALLGKEMMAVLDRLIAGLPEKLRDPLTLSTLEEMSPADIGAVLGINEAAVRSRLFRARQILKEKLTVLRGSEHGSR